MAEHDDFETTEQVGSETFPMQCSALRKNGFVVLKGFPCKIVDMSTSKTGKHGHAKVHLVGLDIFTGKKYEDICPSTHNMEVPVVKRFESQLLDVNADGYCSVLLDNGETREDLQVPPGELGEQLREANENAGEKDNFVTVQTAMGTEGIISFK